MRGGESMNKIATMAEESTVDKKTASPSSNVSKNNNPGDFLSALNTAQDGTTPADIKVNSSTNINKDIITEPKTQTSFVEKQNISTTDTKVIDKDKLDKIISALTLSDEKSLNTKVNANVLSLLLSILQNSNLFGVQILPEQTATLNITSDSSDKSIQSTQELMQALTKLSSAQLKDMLSELGNSEQITPQNVQKFLSKLLTTAEKTNPKMVNSTGLTSYVQPNQLQLEQPIAINTANATLQSNANTAKLSSIVNAQPQLTAQASSVEALPNADDSKSQMPTTSKNAVLLDVIDLTTKQASTDNGKTFSGNQQGSENNLLSNQKFANSLLDDKSSKPETVRQADSGVQIQSTNPFMTDAFTDSLQNGSSRAIANANNAFQQTLLQDDYNIAGQIVKNAQLIKADANSQMTINLQPEHLGQLSLKISVAADGVVNATFHSDNAQVRNLLQATIVELRQDLQDQGIKVDNINIYSGLNDLLSNGENSSGQFTEHKQHKSAYRINQLIDAAQQLEDISTALPIQTQLSANSGIDYRI